MSSCQLCLKILKLTHGISNLLDYCCAKSLHAAWHGTLLLLLILTRYMMAGIWSFLWQLETSKAILWPFDNVWTYNKHCRVDDTSMTGMS